MARLDSKLFLPLVLVALTGCAGVYAQAGITTLPTASYSPTTVTIATLEGVDGSVVKGATVVNLGVGVDFDIRRKYRLAMGYGGMLGSYGKDASGSFGVVNTEFDFNLANLSDNWKFRGGVGLAVGTNQGSVTLPGTAGTPQKQEGISGGGISAGVGLSYYAAPYLGFHLMLQPTYQTVLAKNGRIGGFGATAKLTAVLSFGDTRPDAVIYEPMWSKKNIIPTLAFAARDVLCTATEMNQSSWAAVLVKCPDDKRSVMFFQTPDAIMITCEHSSESDCRERVRGFITATKKKLE